MVEGVLCMHEVTKLMSGTYSSFFPFKNVLTKSDGLSQVIITGAKEQLIW